MGQWRMSSPEQDEITATKALPWLLHSFARASSQPRVLNPETSPNRRTILQVNRNLGIQTFYKLSSGFFNPQFELHFTRHLPWLQ